MIKTIIFDFGNVIGFFDHRRTTDKLAAYSDWSKEDIHAYLYHGELFVDYECGRVSTEEITKQVRQALRLKCSEEELREAFADIFWSNQEVEALVPRLKTRHRLVLGSNTNDLHTQRFMRQFVGTLEHFDALVLSHEIGTRKPAAVFFHECLKRAHCQPQECAFIDDLPANVASARECGIQGIVYSDFADLCQNLKSLGVEP